MKFMVAGLKYFEVLKSFKVHSQKRTCSVHFQMQVCTHVLLSGSHENYFGQCLLVKFQMRSLLHFMKISHNDVTRSNF